MPWFCESSLLAIGSGQKFGNIEQCEMKETVACAKFVELIFILSYSV